MIRTRSQEGSITIFVLIAILFFTTTLLLIYVSNMNKIQTVDEKSEVLKKTYEKNTDPENINNLYAKLSSTKENIEVKNSNSYRYNGKITFTGSNYIDTGLRLFTPDNIDKDFEINFDIISVGDNQKLNTILSSMNEKDSPWPGFVVRISDNNKSISFKGNSTLANKKEDIYSKEVVQKVKIRRIGKKLFYSIDNNEIELLDYSDLEKTFSTTLTFGCSLDGNNNPQRYFKGTISNINVIIQNPTKYHTLYEHKDNIVFDGTNYINTGIKLFDEQNINKDFKIEFYIIELGNNEKQATLLNDKDEKSSPWPGIHIRIPSENSRNIEIAATGKEKKYYAYYIPKFPLHVELKRIDSKFYYSLNYSLYTELNNFSNIAWRFDVPLTFGCSLDGNRNPFRYFRGTISNVKVQLAE